MKTSIILITYTVMCIGCLKPVPPAPEVPQVIVVLPVPTPAPLVIYQEPDAGPPIKTWLLEEDLKEIHRQRGECVCDEGDPLCECL
jgi:hypothetical protein